MMTLLALGLLLFAGVHLVPSAPKLRSNLIKRLGEGGYRAAFAGIALAGLLLIIIGKVNAPFLPLWSPPGWGHTVALVIMPFAFILLVGAYLPSNIKRATAHPMLWSVVVWAVAHLLANGDLASLILFGGLGALALVMMGSAQVRGATVSRTKQPVTRDILAVAAGLIAYVIFFPLHPYLFGAAVFV
jgi:uncharacterized membrane protein